MMTAWDWVWILMRTAAMAVLLCIPGLGCDITYNPLTGFFDCVGGTGGSGTAITAAATSGATERIPIASGDSRAVTWSQCTSPGGISLACPGGLASGGSDAGALRIGEQDISGVDYIDIQAPDSITTTYRLRLPGVPPAAQQVLVQGTPSGSPLTSVATWGDTLLRNAQNPNGYFDWTLGSAPGNPAAGDIRLYPKTGSTLCARDSAGTETCYGSGGGSSTKTYTFQGINQGDVPAWNVNYRTLTNMVFSTLDATHIRPLIVVTANTTGSDLWTVTPVTTTNPTPNFIVSARSTDGTNAGSMALAYACVPSGDSIDNPSYTSLTALSLTTIDPDSEVFTSSQAVTCTGTESAPADLYVKWTPTAPSGGTLSLIKLMLIY